MEFKATDDMFVAYGLGQDFAADKVKANPLFATIGLHLGTGKKPVITR